MATHLEKSGYGYATEQHEAKNVYSDVDSQDGYVEEFTPAEQKKIIHRIDRRLVTTVGLMYCISLMDRTNLAAAAIAGMTKELKLNSIITLVFFISYILFQPPSTVLCKKIGPRIYLSAITLLWGLCMIGMGFSGSWSTLAGLRVLLGVLEAGFFPGCVYLLSTWYVRYDMGKRYSCFYLLGCFASACAGILAYGLMQMNGLAKLTGWRWIFIMEGILTCGVAALGYVFLITFPDSPNAAKSWRFLNAREIAFIIRRVNADRGDVATEPFSLKKFLAAGADLKVWGFAMIFCCLTTVTYALAYFLPIILREGMGFSIGASQCLVAPPYAFAGIVMYLTAWVGDKYHLRGPILIFNAVLALIGLPLMGFHKNVAVRYFGVFLTTAGANANIPACMTYQANNIRGQWKRAFCSATLVGFGGIGGIIGSLVFRSQDAPKYHPGLYACITASLLIIVIVILLDIKFYFDNKKADRGEAVIEGSESGFRYTY
ncbi:hypothetical protein LTR04_001570 [Oleoguttula sp. CCFEE 6159]|nr:hypothetical protein LTR04_001570 [Oleoguttula sp. CCFEE 6159]